MAMHTGIAEVQVAPEPVSAQPRSHFARAMRCAVPSILLAIALLAPFLNKAYTVDDPIFLTGAQQVLKDPLHPSDFTMAWNTDFPQRASEFVANGPGMYYLLAPVMAAGVREWQAHLLMLLIFCCGLCATVSVALRLGFNDREAAWSGVLVAATPAVLAMASTAMPDVPAMAFGTLAVDSMMAWKKSRRWADALALPVLLTLATLMRSHLLLLGGVCLIWLYEPKQSGSVVKQLWPLALVPLLLVSFQVLSRDPQAPTGGLFAATSTLSSSEALVRNLISFFTHFALVIPFAFPFLLISRRRVVAIALSAVATVLTAVFHRSVPLVVPFAVLSATLIATEIVWPAWRERQRVQLFLTSWMMIAFPIIMYFHLPSKYLVPSAAPVAFLLIMKLRNVPRGFARALPVGTAALAIAMGMAIVRADANLAGLCRRGVTELVVPRVVAGERVWFAGTWSFYWYAERAGARQLLDVPPFPRPGDIIVTCSSGSLDYGLKIGGRARKIAYLEDATPGGRIFEGKPRSGFYSNRWGYWPWVWGHDKISSFTVWRVEPPDGTGLRGGNWGWEQR